MRKYEYVKMRRYRYVSIIVILIVFMYGLSILHRVIPMYDNNTYVREDPHLSVTFEWETFIDDEHIIGQECVMDESHNLYVMGNRLNSSENSYDMILMKFDSSGNIIWNQTWGGVLDDHAYALDINTTSSLLYIVGETVSYGTNGSSDAFLLSYNFTGVLKNNITWGGDEWDAAFSVTSASNCIYVADSSNSLSSSQDIFVIKYNSSYSLQWNKTYGTSEPDIGYGMTVNKTSGDVILTGITTVLGDKQAILIKLDSNNGDQLWNKTWGGTSSEEGRSVLISPSDEIVMLANTRSYGSGSTDIALVTFNSTGGFQWQRTWGGTDIDAGYKILYDSYFNLFLIGYTESFGSGKDACIVKYSDSGDYQWYRTRIDTFEDVAYGGCLDENDDIYITGKSGTRLFITKYNRFPDEFILFHDATDPDVDGNFTVSWTESLGAINYTLYHSDAPIVLVNSSIEKIVEGNTNRTIDLNNIQEGTHYYIAVAFNEYGNINSNIVNITVQYPPSEFILSHDADLPDKDGIVNFTWSSSQGADRYNLYLNFSLYKDNITDTSYTVYNLNTNDYIVTVRAINNAGQRTSNEVVVIVRRSPSPFSLTTDATIPDTDGSFELIWTKSLYTQYYILYNSSTFITHINTSVSVLLNFTPSLDLPTYRYSLYGLNNGTYFYQIIAFNNNGNFTSVCVQIIVSIPPPPPPEHEPEHFPYGSLITVITFIVLFTLLIILYKIRKK